MAKKITELKNDDRRAVEEQLETISSSLGMEAWNSHGNERKGLLEDLIGMCYNCRNLNYCKTEFGNVFAKCAEYDIKLSGQNRIIECNSHSPMYIMSLQEMYSIAYLIDSNQKEKAGFKLG